MSLVSQQFDVCPSPISRKIHRPVTMSPDDDIAPHLRTLHIDGTLLELGSQEEKFFKAEMGIQDTVELRKHIIKVHEEAYKVSVR